MAKSKTAPGSSRLRTALYTVAALAALVGLTEATYLTVLYLTGETAVCGKSAECAQVLGSKYAHIGPVPLAGLGVLAYFSVFTLATFSGFGYARARRLLPLLIAAMFVATLVLLYLQAFVLHAFCRYCLFSAALIFLLAGIAVAMPTRD